MIDDIYFIYGMATMLIFILIILVFLVGTYKSTKDLLDEVLKGIKK